ncbi:hypothetical protein AJ80_02278 [Polytolypa hystricis UAMH7299]|uniref:Uncharacterized protein n=1 Tax=Polytolypa hystricis (strain UAMH7299) TaxID=1447883 RepID=A0A2B7YS29_POLH7|nr:hypothetical protein AJ80_02278 [Polytolypa hystricis UAMH7299]
MLAATKELKALTTHQHHPITQPSSRYASPTRALSYPPPLVRISSTPPTPVSSVSSNTPTDATTPTSIFWDRDGDDRKSADADQQVKLALIELLNSEDIKGDQYLRMWVQNRLMDTEHRLKARRKSRFAHTAG